MSRQGRVGQGNRSARRLRKEERRCVAERCRGLDRIDWIGLGYWGSKGKTAGSIVGVVCVVYKVLWGSLGGMIAVAVL